MNRVFNEEQCEIHCGNVRRILSEIGYKVEHQEMSEVLLKKGLKQAGSGRFLFDDKIINEFVEHQKQYTANHTAAGNNSAGDSGYSVGFGNMAPKIYDYKTGLPQLGTIEYLEQVVKYAHMETEIGRITLPLSVTDKPLILAPLVSFLKMAELTDKYGYFIDPLYPELVKYLAEFSDVFLGKGMEDSFIDPCNCINPILHLEGRTAGVMMERAKYNVSSLITSMPTAGGNAPVTIDGAEIQGTAEIVGGVIISWLINPEVNNKGYISSSVMDFRYANTTQSSPETVLIDCGVIELMDYAFGGNTKSGGRSYVTAKKPGMHAVFEKMFKAAAYQNYSGVLDFFGSGILDNGSLFSPEQLILDMEIQKSLFSLKSPDNIDMDAVDAIKKVVDAGNGDFLSSDHTLSRFRDAFWDPALFLRSDGQSEKEILDKAHERYKETLKSYSGYEYDQDKINAGNKILAKAKKELL